MKPTRGALGLLAALTVLGAGAAACGQQAGGLSQQDQTYLTGNAQTDMAEIAAGQLAAQKGTTDAIRSTARTLTHDHQQALSQVQALAQAAHVTVPTTPDQAHLQQTQQLQGLSGVAFDQAYLRDEIQGHQQSISQTQRELQSGTDPRVKQFAQGYLTTAQSHLNQLQTDQRQLGNVPTGANTGSGGQAAPIAPLAGGLAGGGALLVLSAAALFARPRRAGDPTHRG